MKKLRRLPFAITFDCDPLAFDASLQVSCDLNFEHLWQSIPKALDAISEAEKISNQDISATFFIRNLTAKSEGDIIREEWLDFQPLWIQILEKGHYLGLHPHIDFPLESQFVSSYGKILRIMEGDFELLRSMGVTTRVTRVGGHAYNSSTSNLLSSLGVRVDSSAIPGRYLGKSEGVSDWRQYSNRTLRDWNYGVNSAPTSSLSSGLIQVPMCTLEQTSKAGFYRYIDFSFRSFDDHSFVSPRLLKECEYGVSVTHPSTLIENSYLKHQSLEFGIKNWISSFKIFFDSQNDMNVDLHFLNLSEV